MKTKETKRKEALERLRKQLENAEKNRYGWTQDIKDAISRIECIVDKRK